MQKENRSWTWVVIVEPGAESSYAVRMDRNWWPATVALGVRGWSEASGCPCASIWKHGSSPGNGGGHQQCIPVEVSSRQLELSSCRGSEGAGWESGSCPSTVMSVEEFYLPGWWLCRKQPEAWLAALSVSLRGAPALWGVALLAASPAAPRSTCLTSTTTFPCQLSAWTPAATVLTCWGPLLCSTHSAIEFSTGAWEASCLEKSPSDEA